MHTTQATLALKPAMSAEERFGSMFAEATMKATVDAALRRGWTGERLKVEADRFCVVLREEAKVRLAWLLKQGKEVCDLVDAGRMGPGYLDVTFKAAVGAVAARTLARMEA